MSKKSSTENSAAALSIALKPKMSVGKPLQRRIRDNWQLYVMLLVQIGRAHV